MTQWQARSYMTVRKVTHSGQHASCADAWQALIAARMRRGSRRDRVIREMEKMREANMPGGITAYDPVNREHEIAYRVTSW